MFKFVQKKNEKTDYLVGGDWEELKKTQAKYQKALSEDNPARIERYRHKIHSLQERLGVKKTDFPRI